MPSDKGSNPIAVQEPATTKQPRNNDKQEKKDEPRKEEPKKTESSRRSKDPIWRSKLNKSSECKEYEKC